MLDADPGGSEPPALLSRVLSVLRPKRSRLERIKMRALRAFFLLAILVGGAGVWTAALARLESLEVASETVRLVLDATPAEEPYFGILVLATAACFFSVESVVNLLADRVQRSDPPS
jgi:hypothetical protein